MKLFLTFLLSFATVTASAQPDTSYYGRYTDHIDLTGFTIFPMQDSLPGYCFSVSREVYGEMGIAYYSEIGFAHCAMENGRYAVEMETSEVPNLWLTFETDQFGNKTLRVSEEGKADESYFYNPLELESMDAYEPEGLTGEAGILRQHLRKDGALLMIMEDPGTISFLFPGLTQEGKCDANTIEGVLEVKNAATNTYVYKVGDCELLILKIEPAKITVTEKRCGDFHSKKCDSWAGTYFIDNE